MGSRLSKALKEAEGNIYGGISLSNGAIVFLWTLLCLFLVNGSRSFFYAAASGGIYYLASIVLYLYLFKDIRKYLSFPRENKKMPVFIGHKLDVLFTYPVLLMALIGIISNLVMASGLLPGASLHASAAGGPAWVPAVRALLLPLTAFSEELMNLLLVSFIYKYLRYSGSSKLIASIILGALAFGSLHTFGSGAGEAILIGIAYIPVFFVTLYTGSIWISFLAHLYNDLIVLAKLYNGSLYLAIIAVVSLIPAVWAVKSMLKQIR